MFSERLRHSGQSGFRGKIGAHMVSHQHGGAFLDDSERLDHLLLFARWISWNAGGVFQVELPMLHRRGTFEGLAYRGKARSDASVFRSRVGEQYESILGAVASFLSGFHPDANNRE